MYTLWLKITIAKRTRRHSITLDDGGSSSFLLYKLLFSPIVSWAKPMPRTPLRRLAHTENTYSIAVRRLTDGWVWA